MVSIKSYLFLRQTASAFSDFQTISKLRQQCRFVHQNTKVLKPTQNLMKEIVQQVKVTGPLNVHDYMKLALTHPRFGFYMNQDVFGSKGHFTTSPEISQIFGELISVWILSAWMKCGEQKPLRIVELGPGRGTLTADISRVLDHFSQSKDCCSFNLVEISPHLKLVQQHTICRDLPNKPSQNIEHYTKEGSFSSTTVYGQPINWYRSLSQVPSISSGFTVFVANEFFDAFPIYKFVKVSNKWHELLIDIDPNNQQSLRWIQAKNPTPASKMLLNKEEFSVDCIDGDSLEICPDTILHIEQIVDRINQENGCLLLCDYGHDQLNSSTAVNRDTFRAYKNHQQCDPLVDPGTADLTADVDFGYIRSRFNKKANVYGTTTQTAFLKQLGIELRLEKLLENTVDPKHQDELRSGVKMLLEDMGERFKFMAIFGKNSAS